MSYETINICRNDPNFQGRVTACCAQEGAPHPESAMGQLVWPVASTTDIAAAYEAAYLNHNPSPGSDPSVITDQMILSSVQAHWPILTPT